MPLFFAGNVLQIDLLVSAGWAFVAFSAIASAIYILNDFQDIEEDRQHPKKQYRALASGVVSKAQAISLMMALIAVGFGIAVTISHTVASILLIYMLLNVAYSYRLKHIALLDITVIAIGFVLRLFVGSIATGTYLSMWIVIMTFLLALFMALAKRRDDVLIFQDTGQKMRKVIDGYNLQLIDGAMMIMASVVIVVYILYTTSSSVAANFHSEYLYLTALFVVLGILRYLQIAFVENNSGSPTLIVLKDRFIQITLVCWILSFVWIIYL